jgi:hypothetical protein
VRAETAFWLAAFWIVLPALAYNGWGGWPADGWPGVALLLALYAAGTLTLRWLFGRA